MSATLSDGTAEIANDTLKLNVLRRSTDTHTLTGDKTMDNTTTNAHKFILVIVFLRTNEERSNITPIIKLQPHFCSTLFSVWNSFEIQLR